MNIIGVLMLVLGMGIGYALYNLYAQARKKSIDVDIKKIELQAREEAQNIIERAEQKSEEMRLEIKKDHDERNTELKEKEQRLVKKEELLDKRQLDTDKEGEILKKQEEVLNARQLAITETEALKQRELEKIAGLTREEAREEVLSAIEKDYQEDLLVRIRKMEEYNREQLDHRAQDILATAIQRLASSTASDLTTTNVIIPSDEIKGKIIGKEGRNIKSFERAAGVEVIIDDTPGSVIISSFDPIRRQIARVALENLILDGRIQPAKIEEFVEGARNDINKIIKEKGEWAVHELGIYNLDPRIVSILGRLFFRTSYGQNVLTHSVEMAHLAAMMAEELGADVMIAKTGALVHDIGKALDHEVSGTHIEIGMRILRKFGADERVVTAMKSHHDDYPHETVEAVIVTTADTLSGARPGARRDTLENYLKRLQELETLARRFSGVDKAYALSAGREIRIFVEPTTLNDVESHNLAKDIARAVETELRYPGEIKVTVIRENRIIEYAR